MNPIKILTPLPTADGGTIDGVLFTPAQLTLAGDRVIIQCQVSHAGEQGVRLAKHVLSPVLELPKANVPEAVWAALEELSRQGLSQQRLQLEAPAQPAPAE